MKLVQIEACNKMNKTWHHSVRSGSAQLTNSNTEPHGAPLAVPPVLEGSCLAKQIKLCHVTCIFS